MTYPQKFSKLVMFPRPGVIDGVPVTKYVVMGMVITSTPLSNVPADCNQMLLAGGELSTSALLGAFAAMKSGKPELHGSPGLGDATNVLLSLQDIVFAEE